jgi:predicted PurR-regulated permease PerM
MAVLIILCVFMVVLIGISLVFFLWWKKYGKKIFDMVTNLKNIQKNTTNTFDSTHFNQEMERIKKIMDKYQKK